MKYLRLLYADFHIEPEDEGIRATIGNEPLHTAMFFAVHRYLPELPRLSQAELEVRRAALTAAFRADHPGVMLVKSDKLKARGAFVAELLKHGRLWGISHVQALVDLEVSIKAKHEGNRESLEQLLSVTSATGRRQPLRLPRS